VCLCLCACAFSVCFGSETGRPSSPWQTIPGILYKLFICTRSFSASLCSIQETDMTLLREALPPLPSVTQQVRKRKHAHDTKWLPEARLKSAAKHNDAVENPSIPSAFNSPKKEGTEIKMWGARTRDEPNGNGANASEQQTKRRRTESAGRVAEAA